MRRSLARAAVAVSAAIIAALTLTPSSVPSTSAPFFCLTCGAWLQDGLDNVLLFAPFGAALAALGLRRGGPLAIAAATSFCIEFAQYIALPGRDAALTDLIANTLGGALGELAWIAALWLPSPRVARRAVLLLAPLTIAWLAAPSWWFALRRPAGPFWPSLVPTEAPRPAPARLLDARWDGRPMTCCPDERWPTMRDPFATRGADVEVRAVLTGVVERPGSLTTVWDGASNAVIGISIWPAGITGSAATRAQLAGVRDPVLWVPAAQPWAVGDTIAVRLRAAPEGWTLAVTANGRSDTRTLRPIPSLAPWYLLPGVRRTSDGVSWLSRLLMLVPLCFLGWWAGCVGDRRWIAAAALGVPLAAGLAGSPWANRAGAVADLLVAAGAVAVCAGAAATCQARLVRSR